MLAQPSLSSFLEKSLPGRIFPSGVLPLNNNPGLVECSLFRTALVLDTDENTPVAFGIANKCGAKQAYCMVGKVANKYARKFVDVEEVEEVGTDKNKHSMFKELWPHSLDPGQIHILKVRDSVDSPVDKSQMRPYHAVFSEDTYKPLQMTLADSLFEQTIGTFNMNMEKNVTVDIMGADNANMALWRDHAGFVVTDTNRFVEITCDKQTILDELSTLGGHSESSIVCIGKENRSEVAEFDDEVTLYQRGVFLDYILNHDQVNGHLAQTAPGCPTGYALSCGGRVLQCYAENAPTAAKLLCAAASASPSDDITFFAQKGLHTAFDNLVEQAKKIEPVFRLHTRTQKTQVNWKKVFVANIGLSLL